MKYLYNEVKKKRVPMYHYKLVLLYEPYYIVPFTTLTAIYVAIVFRNVSDVDQI